MPPGSWKYLAHPSADAFGGFFFLLLGSNAELDWRDGGFMRKASTRRSEARARVRSTGRNLMMACYVRLKNMGNMYKEQLRLTYPRREGVV